MLKPTHKRSLHNFHISWCKRHQEECGVWGFCLFLIEMSRGLMCGDNLLSYVQLLQHKENSSPSKWHTLH